MDNTLADIRQAWSAQLWPGLLDGASAHPAAVGALDVDSSWMLDEWERELLQRLMSQARGGSVRFVESSVGGGRTHFLHLLSQRARRAGMATVAIPANQQAEVWADPLRLYQLVAEGLLPNQPRGGAGLPQLVKAAPPQLVRAELFPELPSWGMALELWARDDVPAARHYLLGQRLDSTWEGGLHAGLSAREAALALRCLLQFLEYCGEQGLVVLCDGDGEIEESRERATLESLRNLIDRCSGGELPGLLLVFAVLPRFRQQVLPEYEALRQRLHNGFSHGPAGCLRPVLVLEEQRAWRAEQGVSFTLGLFEAVQRLALSMHPRLSQCPTTVRRNAEVLLEELPWGDATAGAARGLTRTFARWFDLLACDSSEPDQHAELLGRFLEAEAL